MTHSEARDRLFSTRISEEEARPSRDLAACYRLVALYGWDDMLATHISARLPKEDGKECFLINPLGLMFDEITASSLIKVAMDGEVLQESPYEVNRAGYVIHSGVLGGAARHHLRHPSSPPGRRRRFGDRTGAAAAQPDRHDPRRATLLSTNSKASRATRKSARVWARISATSR